MKIKIDPESRVKITTIQDGTNLHEFFISDPIEVSGDFSQIWIEPVSREATQLELDLAHYPN